MGALMPAKVQPWDQNTVAPDGSLDQGSVDATAICAQGDDQEQGNCTLNSHPLPGAVTNFIFPL